MSGRAASIFALAAALIGCRTTFELHPSEVPWRQGSMRTTDGELVDAPDDYRATLEPRAGQRFMTPDDRSEVIAYPVADAYVERAESTGWTDKTVTFDEVGGAERRGEDIVIKDEHGRLVHVPLAVVDRVVVVDEEARRANRNAAIAIPTSIGGAAAIGLFILLLVSVPSNI